ncbi:MAG: hypothetical protein U0Q16_13930 [Bryobacteraceae bacterium]
MQRILASLLALAIGFPLISPAVFAADPDSKLPACCRKGGKHGCGMKSGAAGGDSVRAAACPAYPAAKATGAVQSASGLAPHFTLLAPVAGPSVIAAFAIASKRLSLARVRFDRGPPTSLL